MLPSVGFRAWLRYARIRIYTMRFCMIDWSDVQVFLEVSRAGSFSDAALALGVNQSTVSRRVAQLEEQLGFPLYFRGPRGLTPTQNAARMLPHAEKAEAALLAFARASSDAGPDAKGCVRLATVEEIATHLIAPAMNDLARRWPNISLQVLGATASVDLERGQADLALRPSRPKTGNLSARRVATIAYAAYAAESYVDRHRQVVESGCWGSLDWLTLADSMAQLPEVRWVMNCAERPPIMRLGSTTALVEATASGIGVAILPMALASRQRQLRRLDPAASAILTRRLWLVVHRDMRDLPRIRAVSDWLVELLSAA